MKLRKFSLGVSLLVATVLFTECSQDANDATWVQVEGTAKKVSVWGYNKDPKNEMGTFDVETEQLVHMKEQDKSK
ncbi:hypothetical protein [Brevibacillus fortis]|uniref:hypothetical protein n=1 Tax=Brevibacillus fortis TaxID=2126352 RepID=UPI0038FC78AB